MEQKTWWKAITYPERIDYVSFQNNELAFVLAIEKLLELEVPPKATWMRMLLCELNRVHSHLVWLATGALELGAISMFWYCFRERDAILDLFELAAGRACTRATSRPAGSRRTSRAGSSPSAARSCERMPSAVDEYETIAQPQRDLAGADEGPGAAVRDDALALGQSGPVLRASGVDWDLRKHRAVPRVRRGRFPRARLLQRRRLRPLPRAHGGDARVDADRRAGLDRLEGMEGEPWIVDDRKFVLPPRHELHTSMESLIHHFKIVTEGYRVPEGEVYVPIESPRGEFGCYVVSNGGPKPWRVKFRAPSFVALEATATCMSRRARRRPDRDRRLARHRHGRGRPLTHVLRRGAADQGAVPGWRARRSCPALRLAQERTAAGFRRRRCARSRTRWS